MVLVVDDVQAVRSSSSAAVLATLILHMPSGSTLVLSGRELPELPIARLRADREVFEVGVEDLALGRRDAQLLLRGVQPELEAVAAELWERTEGWAAGLHLAGSFCATGPVIVARSRSSPVRTGSSWTTSAWSTSRSSTPPMSPFSPGRRSSSRCADRCATSSWAARASRQPGSRLWSTSSLFVVPLDRSRGWYRYHHLFREALRAELERREPELVPAMYRRAAVWSEANGAHRHRPAVRGRGRRHERGRASRGDACPSGVRERGGRARRLARRAG